MLRMIARRMSQVRTAIGTDEVLFGISLPSDSVIHNIRVKVRGAATADSVRSTAHILAHELWILPVLDPDAGLALDTIWDNLVPKDTDIQTLDLDTAALDTTSFYEPGEIDWTAVFDIGLRPRRLYHRHTIKTIGDSAAFIFQDNQTPFAVKWIGKETFQVNITRRLRVSKPSMLLMACATPSLDDTTTTGQTALAEAEWGQVKYMTHLLERAMLHIFGVFESGAETPWEEATAILQKHLDPDLFEENGGSFSPVTYDLYTEAVIDHSVVGELGKTTVTTGR